MGVRAGPGSDSPSLPLQISPESYPPQLLAPSSLGVGTPGPALEGNETTVPRSLNGVEVTSEEIDDLYQL